MRKIIILIMAVFILIFVGIFSGIIPAGGLLENGTTTKSIKSGGVDEWTGNKNYELLDQKAYILSYKNDGHSEKITIRGKITKSDHEIPFSSIDKVNYKIFLKENAWSDYELVSQSMYISNPCSQFKPQSPSYPGYLKTHQFTIIGDKYIDGAIKVELWAKFDYTPWDGEGDTWHPMAIDEAYLYSGLGGLYLPRGIEDGEDRPYSTFEVGSEVKIRVETGKGGYDEEVKPWRVTLNEPYGGDVEFPDDGGSVVREQSYQNDAISYFTFTVTEEMAKKSMQSEYPYTVRIWNVLLPKGSLYIDFLDFIALAPSDVEFDVSDIQIKVGETASVDLSASSDLGIDYFRISVIYGTNDVLLPSDPLSKLWLIHTSNIGNADREKCSIPQTIEFKPEYESYITVHAKAFDTEGRGSVRTRTYTFWAYQDSAVPDEIIQDETGEEDYGGGQTPGYYPWDPSGGNWGDFGEGWSINGWGVLVVFLITIGCAFLGWYVFKGNPRMIILMVLIGILIGVIVYVLFYTDMIL